MTSAPFDFRSDLMHKSYDSKSYHRTRKAQAVERLFRLLYRRVAPDFRVVHRFREWQINDLNSVLQSIYLQHKWKSERHKRGMLVLLSYKVQRNLTRAIRLWRLSALLARYRSLTPNVLAGGVKLVKFILGHTLSTWASNTFPMFYSNDRLNRPHLLSTAISVWKSQCIGYLLYDSRREMGVVRLGQALYLKAKPLIKLAFDQLNIRRGFKLGLMCLTPVLRRVIRNREASVVVRIRKRETDSRTPDLMQMKGAFLQLFRAMDTFARVHMVAYGWNRLKREVVSTLDSRKVKRLVLNLRDNHKQVQLRALYTWKSTSEPQVENPEFDIDMEVIRNQMQVAVMLEQQTYARRIESLSLSTKLKLFQAFKAPIRRLRAVFWTWRTSRVSEEKYEDVLFEYVRFLEEQNGIQDSRVPNRLR